MKSYEKPKGNVTNLQALLDEAVSLKKHTEKLQPALATGDNTGGNLFAASSGYDFSRFTQIDLS